MDEDNQLDHMRQTAAMAAVMVSKGGIQGSELPGLLRALYAFISRKENHSDERVNKQPRAVTVRKSLASRDFILSMIDGRPYKSLGLHIRSHGFTAQTYREAYDLPDSYPMVARNYSDKRREIIKATMGTRWTLADTHSGSDAFQVYIR